MKKVTHGQYNSDLSLAQRGDVYSYNFRFHPGEQGNYYKGELAGIRAVVLTDHDPAERLRRRLALHVIPLVRDILHPNLNAMVTVNNVLKTVMTCNATTINSERIEAYCGRLEGQALEDIAQSAEKVFRVPERGAPGPRGAPGSFVDVPWDNGGRRQFIIVGSPHLTTTNPVLAVPVESLTESGEEIEGLKCRPLSTHRMAAGRLLDQLGESETRRLVQAVRAQYT